MPETLVVIGGNTAGLAAALAARRRRPDLEIQVLEAGETFSYGACGMPYNLADPHRSPDDLIVRPAEDFRARGIRLVPGCRVVEVDPSGRLRARVGGGLEELAWDRLVVASGARARELSIPGLPLEAVRTFRTRADLSGLKARAHPPARAVVVGAGPNGLELAEALRRLGLAVLLADLQDLPLAGFPDEARLWVREELDRQGVQLSLGWRVARGEAPQAAGAPLRLVLEPCEGGSPREVETDLLVNTAGQRAATDFLDGAGPARDAQHGALLVDAAMLTSHPRIWAAGDAAARPACGPTLPGEASHVWHPQAREARRGGRVAGWNAAGGPGEELVLPPATLTLALRCFDLELARCGRWQGPDPVPAEESARQAPASQASHGLLGQAMPPSAGPRPHLRHSHSRGATLGHAMPGAGRLDVWLEARADGRLRGGALLSAGPGAALRANVLAALLHTGGTAADLAALDLVYSPPFGPLVDPLIRAAERLVRD